MIETSTDLAEALRSGGYRRDLVADLIVDGERKIADLTLASCEVKSNGNAKIRTQGTASVLYADELGESIVATDLSSWLTPYATYLNLGYRVRVGDLDERVPLGQLKVVGVNSPRETTVRNGGRLVTLGSSVGLTLADAFAVTDRERFPAPASPPELDSVWAEVGRLTRLPLLRNVADTTIPRSVTYPESTLDAVLALGRLLGGTPYVNSLGQVTVQPDEWGDETEPLDIGPEGQIVEADPSDLSDDGIYNQVVVRSHDDDQVRILATAQVSDGPLRFGGPFGKIPYFASSPFVTNEADAQAYADELLPRVSSEPAAAYFVQCLPDPRREVGDVVPFTRNGDTQLVGRIAERTIGSSGPMTLKVLVG